MMAVAAMLANVGGHTPNISGGDSPAGTDRSGVVSWVANAASGRPMYRDRFSTANEEAELRDVPGQILLDRPHIEDDDSVGLGKFH